MLTIHQRGFLRELVCCIVLVLSAEMVLSLVTFVVINSTDLNVDFYTAVYKTVIKLYVYVGAVGFILF